MAKQKWQVSLTIAFVALGLLLSFQFKTQKALRSDLSQQSTENLLALTKNLNDRSFELNREVWDLKAQKKLLEKSVLDNNVDKTMRREMEKLHIANGSTWVQGNGIIITISQPDANNFFYHNDLLEIINEVWNAGAEAVAVNNQRIIVNSKVSSSQTEPFIAVNNNVSLSYPIVVKAIGEPETLSGGVNIATGVISKLNVQYGIPIEVKLAEKLKLPPSSDKPKFNFAKKG